MLEMDRKVPEADDSQIDPWIAARVVGQACHMVDHLTPDPNPMQRKMIAECLTNRLLYWIVLPGGVCSAKWVRPPGPNTCGTKAEETRTKAQDSIF